MSVNLVQFPLEVSEWQKSVSYLTDIVTGRNGQEVRNAIWQDPLLKFNATFSIKSYADIQTLVTFFHAMKGREQAFLVKDWADFKIDTWTQPTETGSGTTFQLIKKYLQTIGATSTTYTRTIKYPKLNSVSVVDDPGGDGSPLAISSVNLSTGVVTLSGAADRGEISFKCSEFYVPVRFDIDELPVEMLHYWVDSGKALVEIPEIPLVEVR